jgi:hypothetical protein
MDRNVNEPFELKKFKKRRRCKTKNLDLSADHNMLHILLINLAKYPPPKGVLHVF